jgi:hypothetical protein
MAGFYRKRAGSANRGLATVVGRFEICIPEARLDARNSRFAGNSRFLTGLSGQFGMTDMNFAKLNHDPWRSVLQKNGGWSESIRRFLRRCE